MDLRSIQKPLKEKYRNDPTSSRITLRAQGAQSDSPIACSVEVGQKQDRSGTYVHDPFV